MNFLLVIQIATAIIGGFGLLLCIAGARALIRRSRPAFGVFFLVSGLLLVALIAFVNWNYPQALRQLFESDYEADQKRLEDLRNAKWDGLVAGSPAQGEWPQ